MVFQHISTLIPNDEKAVGAVSLLHAVIIRSSKLSQILMQQTGLPAMIVWPLFAVALLRINQVHSQVQLSSPRHIDL